MKLNALITLTTSIASSVILFTSLSAHAVLQEPGTFVPAQCGPQTEINFVGPNISEVCIGSVVGEDSKAVEFRMVDQPSRLFRVARESNVGIGKSNGTVMAVMTMVNDDGKEADMKTIQTPQGDITAVKGTLGDVSYTIVDFKTMFSVQSL
jgi:hypothetical protein